MDRNTVIGFSLIFLILVGYFYYTKPSDAELAASKRSQDSIARVETAKKAAITKEDVVKTDSLAGTDSSNAGKKAIDTIALASQYGGFAAQLTGTAEIIELKNELLQISLSSKGGRIAQVQLPQQKRWDQAPLVLMDEKHSAFWYDVNTRNSSFRTDAFIWKVVNKSENSVAFRLENGKGGYMEQVYSLKPGSYVVDYKLNLVGIQEDVLRGNADLKLNWEAGLRKQEKDKKWELQSSSVYYKIPGEEPDNMDLSEPGEESLKTRPEWVSFKQQYFNMTLASESAFDKGAKLSWKENTDSGMVKNMKAELYLPYDLSEKQTYSMSFFFGPNHFKTLKNASIGVKEHELQKIIPLGWSFFGWINRYLVIPVFDFLGGFMGNMGIIILCLTLVVKTLLFPLVYKSYMSTAKMRILKPEMDAIKEKHGGDMQKMQVDNMALYRKAGVSPMSGCIPMLLQLPILFAMFQFFPSLFDLRQQPFLWATDLSRYDSVWDFGFNIPFYGDHVSLFTLLMTVSTLIYTHFNNQISGVTGQMKWIGYFMPIIFLGVLNDYAAGLTWYYFVSNMVTFAQQWGIRKFVDDAKLHAQIAENRKKPVKKSAFAQRMEEAMKQQQKVQAGKKKKK